MSAGAPLSAGALLAQAAARFAAAGLETPRLEARLLLGAASGVDPAQLALDPERAIAPDAAQRFESFIVRRLAHEPSAYITGRRGFWTMELETPPGVLIPRPETEGLIDAVLADIPPEERGFAFDILDLGTGTGAILIALLTELPNAAGTGIDVSPLALETAQRNALSHGAGARAQFMRSSWFSHAPRRAFDLIVSNPPYIETAAIKGLAPEVAAFEPPLALDGGADGLGAYRAIAAGAGGFLAPGGRLFLEIGAGQGAALRDLFSFHGFTLDRARADFSGIERILAFRHRG